MNTECEVGEESFDIFEKLTGKCRDEEISSVTNTTYLDHAGTPLPPKILLSAVFEELLNNSFANPHTIGGRQSNLSVDVIEEARRRTLDYLGLKNDGEYQVIFTSGTTSAIKLVGEMFPWSNFSEFWYPPNGHTSLLGLRSFVQETQTRCIGDATFYPALPFDNNTSSSSIYKTVSQSIGYAKMMSQFQQASNEPIHHLVGMPGECNMTGAKLQVGAMVNFMEELNKTSKHHHFYWLLDAAKLAGSSEINLSTIQSSQRPHFIALSFYKIFGYPTGIGALVVRTDCMQLLKKSYFGGGTLLAGAVDIPFQVPKPQTTVDHFEDGTPNFHGIAAIRHGFDFIHKIGGMSVISDHTHRLRIYLEGKMRNLYHHDDDTKPLCKFYHDPSYTAMVFQGPVIAFNLQYSNGYPVSFHEVGKIAVMNNIQLRTGCFCNLGGCQLLLGITGEDAIANYQLGRICSADYNEVDIINGKNTGLCRISLGFGSTKKDCDIFVEFLRREFLNRVSMIQQLQNLLPPPSTHSTDDILTVSDITLDEKESLERLWEEQEQELFWHKTVFSYPYSFPSLSYSAQPSHMTEALAMSKPSVKVAALFVYPIKSCSGVRVDNWPVNKEGLLFDRYFAIADERGKIINQKQFPQMALIQPSFLVREAIVNEMGSSSSARNSVSHKQHQMILQISCTNGLIDSVLEIPLTSTTMPLDSDISVNIDEEFRVCGRKTKGKKVSHDADEWMSQFFFLTSLLQAQEDAARSDDNGTQLDETGERQSDPFQKRIEIKRKKFYLIRSTMLVEESPAQVEVSRSPAKNSSANAVKTFANTAQYLLLSTPSIKTLIEMIRESHSNDQSASNIKVENFRPNILVRKDVNSFKVLDEPHMEDGWKSIDLLLNSDQESNRSMGLSLAVTGPCSRCSMVNVNGQTGMMDCRVFDALKGYRKDGSSVYFGQFLTFESLFQLVDAGESGIENIHRLPGPHSLKLQRGIFTIRVGDRWFING